MKMSWVELLVTTWVSQPDYLGLERKFYVQLYKICQVKFDFLHHLFIEKNECKTEFM